MNPQPSPATYYPPSQPYNPYVCLPTHQFHFQPSVLPTKTTTTPPIYQPNLIPLGLVTPTEPEPQVSDPKPPTTLLCVVNSAPSPDSLGDLGHQLEVPVTTSDGIDHSSPALLDDLIHHWANVTAVDVTVDGEIELQSVGTLNQELKMQFPAIDDEKLFTRLDKLERGSDETCERDAGRDPRRNSDEKVQSKESGAIVDFPLVMYSANSSQEIDNCVIKVYDRYDTLDNIELDEFCKELELGIRIWTILVYQYCKLGQFDKAKRLLCEVIKLCFMPTPIVGNALFHGFNSGQENLSIGDRFENFKVDSDMVLAKIWVRWKSEVAAGNTIEGGKELNVEFTNITMDCLENILGCNIDLNNDNDALWSVQYQIVCSSLPTACVLPIQSSYHNMRRIIGSHFRCHILSDIGIYETVTKVTNIGAIDYSNCCFILVSQNLFQVTILNSKSKAALLGLQFVMSSVTLELLFVEYDKSGSMFMDNVIKTLGDVQLDCNHWIVEWAKEKPGWEELFKYDSKFNQHVLIKNVIAHAQLKFETLLDELGHTRVLGLHDFLGDKQWNVLQRFMEFKIMIRGKDTTSELTARQGVIVEFHQRYLGKLNARYVALLRLREVIFVEEFGKIVTFGVSSEEIIDSPKIISELYSFWIFEVDTEVVLATLRIDQFMSLTFLDQFITNNYVFNVRALLEVHYHSVGYYVGVKNFPQIGFDCNFRGKRVFAGQESIWSLDLQLCHGNLATVLLALCMNQGYYSLLTMQYKSVMIRLSTEPTLEWFIKQKTLIQVITRARGENEELLLLNVTLLVLGFSAYSDAHCNILLHILAGFCFAMHIARMLTTIIVDWFWQVLFLLTNGESISVESTWHSKPKTHSLCLPFHDKPGVCKVTTIAELIHKEDDLLYYFHRRITLSIFYFGFVSSLSNYGCFWYNIFGAVFGRMMTLKLLSMVDSSHGTSLKTLGLSYVQGMRTCLKLRGQDC